MSRTSGSRGERGLATILTSLVLVPLMMFAAFGVDVASWYVRVGDLQRAADAAALAGAVWMPNLAQATTEANTSLRANGFVDGQDGIQVEVTRGSTPTALRVHLTDTDADRYFSAVFSAGPQSLDRTAEARYHLPLPLGSPLNYFGGDASKTIPATPGTTYAVAWPLNYATAFPSNVTSTVSCNVGGSGQSFGRWSSSGYSGSAANSGTTQCRWTATTSSLPTDYTTRAPSNAACNVVAGTGAQRGRWTSATSYSASAQNSGTTLCQWTANISNTTPSTPPNPIASGRSPGFWAQIHGPGADQQSGDAYSTRCTTTTNCPTVNNPLYIAPGDVNQGYWYVVQAPPGGGGSTTIRVFDAQLTTGDLSVGPGDSAVSGSDVSFSTSYRVYQQTNPLDFTSRTPVTAASANQSPGSCNWVIDHQAAFRGAWVDLCTVTIQPTDTFLINVRTTTNGAANSAGRNGYALEACLVSSCTAGIQPAIHAYERMVLYNNVNSGAATFYIAEVGPQYAGGTLVLELFDPGESSSGDAWVYPMMPSATQPRAIVNIPPARCTFESTRSGYPRGSDVGQGGNCSFRSANNGALYNGQWVTIRIAIPNTYTCSLGVDPELHGGSCWWGIRYSFGGPATDTTTWRAQVEGNPLQLTQ